jgi:hypothetical protein
MRAPAALLLAAALLVTGCGQGRVSNDDDLSRKAAEHAAERFLTAVHDGRFAAACALLPGQQQGGLGRLSRSRGGPGSCTGALQTLREFAPARRPGALAFGHEIGFRGALPHKAKVAVDDVSLGGRFLGSIGLRRSGDRWSVAVVCDCP